MKKGISDAIEIPKAKGKINSANRDGAQTEEERED